MLMFFVLTKSGNKTLKLQIEENIVMLEIQFRVDLLQRKVQ